MSRTHILVFIAISMLVLGCIAVPGGPKGGETTGPAGGNGGAAGGVTGGAIATGGDTNASGSGTGSSDGGSSGQQDGGQQGGDQGAGNDFVGKTYEQLLGLGVPMQCDITVTSEGQTTRMKVYMKNSGEVRNEIPFEGESAAMCSRMVSILKGKTFYTGCEGSKYPPGTSCDWMKMVLNDTGVPAGGSVPSDYSDVPPAQINCLPWVPDESKFATAGKICTQEDIINEMMNQYS